MSPATSESQLSGVACPALRIAVIDPHHAAPPAVKRLFAATNWCRCELVDVSPNPGPTTGLYTAAVIVDAPGDASNGARVSGLDRVIQLAQAFCPVSLILTDRPEAFASLLACHVCLHVDSSIELVRGALLGLAASGSAMGRIDSEHAHIRRMSDSVHRHIEAMDAELRLASRLQQHFIPQGVKRFGPVSFETLFRPCSWVSGDLFDIFQLDNRHVGFYLADVVGHGVAAGLLTMYIKHAIRPIHTRMDERKIRQPCQVLASLNDELAGEAFEDSQFITMWYGLLNLQTLHLDFASAGHPPPLLVGSSAHARELHGSGGLLGLSEGQRFEGRSAVLSPGDRILLYSDGLDGVLIAHRPPLPEMPLFQAGLADLLRLPAAELLGSLQTRLDNAPGSLNKADDVSVIVLDVDGNNRE